MSLLVSCNTFYYRWAEADFTRTARSRAKQSAGESCSFSRRQLDIRGRGRPYNAIAYQEVVQDCIHGVHDTQGSETNWFKMSLYSMEISPNLLLQALKVKLLLVLAVAS